jgi:hypothetical protein
MSQARSLLIVFMSITELSWFYPWLAVLGRLLTKSERVLGPGAVFGLFFLALIAVRLLGRWRIAERYQRLALGGLILLTALLLIHIQVYSHTSLLSSRWLGASLSQLLRFEQAMSRELFLILATLAIWWRGLTMAQESLFTDVVGFKFRLGILFVIALLVVQAVSYREDVTFWMLSLFLCGLVAVALARVKDGTPAGDESRQFSPSWLLLLLVGAGGTLLLGLLLSRFFTTETIVSRALGLVFRAVLAVLFYIFVAVSYALVWVINALVKWFVGTFLSGEPVTLEPLNMSPLAFDFEQQLQGPVEPPVWFNWVLQGLVVLIVVILFLLLLVLVRRWRLGAATEGDVWRESVWSSREVGQGLLNGLRGGLRRLADLFSGRERRPAYSAATVRRIYASLLALAEKRGAVRPPPRTPLEYLATLQAAFPGWGTEVRVLTRAYVDAHYGRLPDTEAEFQALQDAWRRIRAWAEAQPSGEPDA